MINKYTECLICNKSLVQGKKELYCTDYIRKPYNFCHYFYVNDKSVIINYYNDIIKYEFIITDDSVTVQDTRTFTMLEEHNLSTIEDCINFIKNLIILN